MPRPCWRAASKQLPSRSAFPESLITRNARPRSAVGTSSAGVINGSRRLRHEEPDRKRALVEGQLWRISRLLDARTPHGLRDRAMIIRGWADDGNLIESGGNTTDYSIIEADLKEWASASSAIGTRRTIFTRARNARKTRSTERSRTWRPWESRCGNSAPTYTASPKNPSAQTIAIACTRAAERRDVELSVARIRHGVSAVVGQLVQLHRLGQPRPHPCHLALASGLGGAATTRQRPHGVSILPAAPFRDPRARRRIGTGRSCTSLDSVGMASSATRPSPWLARPSA
jgi:hypothetical protein